MVLTAMMAAVAAILMLFEFPLPFLAPGFYELDFSEVPVLIGTFAMGPAAGVMIEFLKILLHLLFKGTSTAYVGELGNFIVGCFFLLPAGLLYLRHKTKTMAMAGLAAGTVLMTAAGCFVMPMCCCPGMPLISSAAWSRSSRPGPPSTPGLLTC